MAKKNSPYALFLEEAKKLQSINKKELFPSIIVLHGNSDYFIEKITGNLRTKARNFGYNVASYESGSLTPDKFNELWEACSLFEPRSMSIIKRCEKPATLVKYLKNIEHAKKIQNTLVFCHKGKLGKPFNDEIKRLSGHCIQCAEPNLYEIEHFIKAMASKLGLKLTANAVGAIKDAIGIEPSKVDNELQKLSLIFHDRKTPLDSDDISKYVGIIREDHAFALTRLILDRKKANAHTLLMDLLRRGEKPIAILGILSRHCRNSLQIKSLLNNGKSSTEIAQQVGIPPRVVGTFTSHLANTTSDKLLQSLQICHEADLKLKTGQGSSELILSEVLTRIN